VPGPGDKPEKSIQGALAQADLDAGPFQGEWCGMHEVGHNSLPSAKDGKPRGSFGDVQLFGHCAYASMRDPSNLNLASTGTAVLDVRVPANPIWLRTLRTPAMQRAYSALEIQKGIMIGAFKDFGPGGNNWFDIYDVSHGCLEPDQPKLLATTTTSSGNHDGWLAPDTNTYYGVPFGGQTILVNPNRIDLHVLDTSDKANPKRLLDWNRRQLPPEVYERLKGTSNFHDVSTNDAGTRVYLALYGGLNAIGGPNNTGSQCANGLLILDSSDVAFRRPNPQLRYVSFMSWCDPKNDPVYHYFDKDFDDGSSAAAHATEYVIHENGKEYIVSTDESSAGLDGEWNIVCRQHTFGRLIDIADETHPRVVSTFKPDVGKPDNCARMVAEQINGGMIHYIGFDDRYKMRLVFYAGANYGIRVVDFRDPIHPKEIAYYKAPSVETTQPGNNDFTRPDPRYDRANCMLYTGWNQGGLRILELTDPDYNACMRRRASGEGGLARDGRKRSVEFEFHAKRERHGPKGELELKDRAADAKVRIKALSSLGSVRDQCGTVLPTATSVQFEGTGTYNGKPASFRVCVQDNGRSADQFYLACTSGCAYSVGGAVADGKIRVREGDRRGGDDDDDEEHERGHRD